MKLDRRAAKNLLGLQKYKKKHFQINYRNLEALFDSGISD